MSNKDINASSADASSKNGSNTVLAIVLIIVVLCFLTPLIIGAIIVFGVLGFVGEHIGDFDIDGFINGIEYIDENGQPLTHNESAAVRNIISAIENKTTSERTISRRDCLYMERISENYETKWIDDYSESDVKFCDNPEIYAGVTFTTDTKYSESPKYNGDGYYDLYLTTDSATCAHFTISGFLNSHNGYGIDKSFCNDSNMVNLKIVDTGEELEPSTGVHVDIDEDDESDIKIRVNA
jgi:hypothetical protein